MSPRGQRRKARAHRNVLGFDVSVAVAVPVQRHDADEDLPEVLAGGGLVKAAALEHHVDQGITGPLHDQEGILARGEVCRRTRSVGELDGVAAAQVRVVDGEQRGSPFARQVGARVRQVRVDAQQALDRSADCNLHHARVGGQARARHNYTRVRKARAAAPS
jgi:hypothetical protein